MNSKIAANSKTVVNSKIAANSDPNVDSVVTEAFGIGMIGAGFHATSNILPSLVLAGIPIQALATRDLARSAAALRRFGSDGRPFERAADLLADPGVQNVVIVAQPADATQLALAAIRAGRNAFVDKPLGRTPAEAQQIADEADAHGVIVMTGFMKRYAPAYRALKALLDDGELGTIRSFEISFGCDSTPFCADDDEFLLLAAIHVIDLVRFLFGDVEVAHTVSNSSGRNISIATTLRTASGTIGTLNLSGLAAYSSETEILRVSGDHGFAVATDLEQMQTHLQERGADAAAAAAADAAADADADAGASWRELSHVTTTRTPAASAMSGVERDLYLRGFVGELLAFRQAVDAGEAPSSSARDNVHTMELWALIAAGARASRAGGQHGQNGQTGQTD